jgi:hypothetical protein
MISAMARWKPNTVEEIQAWERGEYKVNPTDEEYDRAFWEWIRSRTAALPRLRRDPR